MLLLVSLSVTYILYRRVSSYAHPDGSAPKGAIVVTATAPESGLHYDKATLVYRGPLAILQSYGSLHAIGAQHGRLLADDIREIKRSLHENVQQTVDTDGTFGNVLHNIRLRWRWRTLDDGIPGHQLVELAGLVRGAKKSARTIGFEDKVRQTAIFDVGAPAFGTTGAELWTVSRALTLLVPVTSELGNRLLVARSFGLPGVRDGGDAIRQRPLVHITHPDDALAHASLSWPGQIGVISGVNEASLGVFLHFTTTADVRLTREAQPSPLLAKEILENAHTLEEAISILKAANPLGSAIFVLVDGKERSWAIVERSPSHINTRLGQDAEAIVDVMDGAKFKDDPLGDRSRRTRPMLMRRERAKQLLSSTLESPEDVVAILRDNKAVGGAGLPLGHGAAIDDVGSVQSAVFDLSGMVLWVSENSEASGHFRAIDLRHELQKTSGSPAPPPDIDGSGQYQGARLAVRDARELLRQARQASAAGKKKRAQELAASALAKAPGLPEALLVAGRLAQKNNQNLEARALLQRYLEVGADDLRAREQVEAWLGEP